MTSGEIREKFLNFFKSKEHAVVKSDLLVPRNDPTLLFTGAGMNQFKEQFMGRNITFKRATSCQKCLRTGDLENVGKTPRHHTFFEMMGNFSFGDYFKKEAIEWAWEFMTKEMALPEDRLWVSVYEDDEESYSIWLNDIKVPAGKIVKLGTNDNFWPADAPTKGPNGPCGPCSEIFYDWGEDTGCGKPSCDPSCDCERFIEVWNLVFTEFERKPDGALDPLPNKNIDTGMGLERMVSVMQQVKTNFETDLFIPIIDRIKSLLPRHCEGGPCESREAISEAADLNLIADHVRAVTFTIADGVSPSNEKRGYVVRKLIRKAWLKGNHEEPFLFNIVPAITKIFKDVYPELEEKREHISAIVEEEERRFNDTIETALPVLSEMLLENPKVLKGEQVFKLFDTYGIPVDIIKAVSRVKYGIDVDLKGFEELMSQRKEQSRKGSDMSGDFIFRPDQFANAPNPSYSDVLPLEASLEFILKADKAVNVILEGEQAEIITSPQSEQFYAEAGGQVGDAGSISKTNARMEVVNTFQADGKKVLQAIVKEGSFKKGDKVVLDLDKTRRSMTAKNHTATHLLQAALRQVLGEHVKQSGSFVDDKRLRFDFTHMKKLSDRELEKIEGLVNAWIEEGISVSKETKSLEEAKAEGALSFFGEKYGDTVRVVTIGARSKELCGGTHVDNVASIEAIKITSESSVASGLRRIEAVTGKNVEIWIKDTLNKLLDECKLLAAGDDIGLKENVALCVQDIINDKIKIDAKVISDFDRKIKPALLNVRERLGKLAKKQKKEIASSAFDDAKEKIEKLVRNPDVIDGLKLVSGVLEDLEMPVLRKAVAYLEKKVDQAIILLGSSTEGKAYLICAVAGDIAEKGINALQIISSISDSINGSGGGKSTFAQAGGKNPEGLKAAIEKAKSIIKGLSSPRKRGSIN